jgi:hypothetical protein
MARIMTRSMKAGDVLAADSISFDGEHLRLAPAAPPFQKDTPFSKKLLYDTIISLKSQARFVPFREIREKELQAPAVSVRQKPCPVERFLLG